MSEKNLLFSDIGLVGSFLSDEMLLLLMQSQKNVGLEETPEVEGNMVFGDQKRKGTSHPACFPFALWKHVSIRKVGKT